MQDRSRFVPLALMLATGCAPPPEPAPEGVFVGAAVVDLTPDEVDLQSPDFYLGGYGFPYARRVEGVHDPVHARSFVLESAGEVLVFVSLDAPGMSNRIRKGIAERVAEATSLDADRVLVGATHTHAGPDLQGIWGGVPQRYREWVIEEGARAAIEAFEGRRRATLRASTGPITNRNRRGWDFTDDAFPSLEALGEDGEPITTLVSFAAHPIVLGADNRLLSRDFVGYTVDALEAALGGTAVYFNGIQGDVTPSCPPGEYADDYAKNEACGLAYAAEVLEGMQGAEQLPDAPLVVRRAGWEQRVENRAFRLALGIADYEVRAEGSDDDPEYFLSLGAVTFSLGDSLSGIAFPGEPLTRLGLRLKEALPGRFKLFLGLTTDSTGYYVPEDEWQVGRNDDYEESVSLAKDAGMRAIAEIENLLAR